VPFPFQKMLLTNNQVDMIRYHVTNTNKNILEFLQWNDFELTSMSRTVHILRRAQIEASRVSQKVTMSSELKSGHWLKFYWLGSCEIKYFTTQTQMKISVWINLFLHCQTLVSHLYYSYIHKRYLFSHFLTNSIETATQLSRKINTIWHSFKIISLVLRSEF
jgi:hypothetical protein